MPTHTRQRISVATVAVRVWLGFSIAGSCVAIIYALIYAILIWASGGIDNTPGNYGVSMYAIAFGKQGIAAGIFVASICFWQSLAEWSNSTLSKNGIAYFGSLMLVVGMLIGIDFLFPPERSYPVLTVLAIAIGVGALIAYPIQRGRPRDDTIVLCSVFGAMLLLVLAIAMLQIVLQL